MNEVQVKLFSGKVVTALVVKENPKTIWVQLPDGNVVKRHKKKHLVSAQPKKSQRLGSESYSYSGTAQRTLSWEEIFFQIGLISARMFNNEIRNDMNDFQ
jgi:hypothetical protein